MTDEGKAFSGHIACRRTPFGEVLFTGEKYPKAAGDTGAEGPFRAKCPRFPGPLSEYVRRRCYSSATELESSCLPVRLFSVVTPLPEQRYPPRLVSSFNSITFLNAAQSLCAVFQSLPEQLQSLPLKGKVAFAKQMTDEGNADIYHTSAPL